MSMMLCLKIAKYLIPFLVGGLLSGTIAWKWQGAKIADLKYEVKVNEDALQESIKTITFLKDEVGKINQTCQTRLAGKDTVIARLRQIDNLGETGKKGDKDENDKGPVSNGGDPVLNELNRMWK